VFMAGLAPGNRWFGPRAPGPTQLKD